MAQETEALRPRLVAELHSPGVPMNFHPIPNGIDFLLTALDHLRQGARCSSGPVPRELKHAVLHLQAAAEVLLKHRLQLEHWSLVFKNPGKARPEELADGSLTTCTLDEAIDRLRGVVGISLEDKYATALLKLARIRNALMHYGHAGKTRAVEAQAIEVFDFLLHFLDTQLVPALPESHRRAVTAEMEEPRRHLCTLQSFMTKRMQRIRVELERCTDRTVYCSVCSQWALVFGDRQASCRFCGTGGGWPVDEIALEYSLRLQDGYRPNRWACPECGHEGAQVCRAVTAAIPDKPVDLCFACGHTTPAGHCWICRRPLPPLASYLRSSPVCSESCSG